MHGEICPTGPSEMEKATFSHEQSRDSVYRPSPVAKAVCSAIS
ncbi:hypothetical protein AVEN_200033-1, partial [Araneus ventricosus]